jgi:hypothetical protein
MRLKYALPLANMAVAVALFWWSDQWLKAAMRIYDSPGTHPAFTLALLINGPATLARMFWFSYVSQMWDYVLFVLVVGITWWWIGIGLTRWREGRLGRLSSMPVRCARDILAVGLSVCFAYGCRSVDILHMPWQWLIPSAASFAIWSLVPPVFFGCDLVRCFRNRLLQM